MLISRFPLFPSFLLFRYPSLSCLALLSRCLLSSSKDTLVKVWDLETQHCVQTLVEHRSEVWAIAVNQQENRLYTASGDDEVRVWKLKAEEDGVDVRETKTKEVRRRRQQWRSLCLLIFEKWRDRCRLCVKASVGITCASSDSAFI